MTTSSEGMKELYGITNIHSRIMSDFLTRIQVYVINGERCVEVEHYPVIDIQHSRDNHRYVIHEVTFTSHSSRLNLTQVMKAYPEHWCDDVMYVFSLGGDTPLRGDEDFLMSLYDDMFTGKRVFVPKSSPTQIHMFETGYDRITDGEDEGVSTRVIGHVSLITC